MSVNVEKHIDELAKSVEFMLNTRRGSFYPNKNFGSLIKSIKDEPRCEYALSYARQALDGIDGVYVKSAIESNNKFIISLMINDCEREVEVKSENIL